MAYCSPAGISRQKCQLEKEKDHPRPFRAPTSRSCFTKNMRSFQKHGEISSRLCLIATAENSHQPFPFLKGNDTHRFRHFVPSLADVSQTELIQWSQQKAKLFPIGRRPRARVSNSLRQSFSSNLFQIPRTKFHFSLLLLSLRELLVALESSRFLLTELTFLKTTPSPADASTPKARLTKLRPLSHRPRYSLLLCVRALWEKRGGGIPHNSKSDVIFHRNSSVDWQILVREMRFTRGTQRYFIWTWNLIVLCNLSQSWSN